METYQQILDADQSGNGVKPILAGRDPVPDTGYVRVAALATPRI